ETAGRTGACVWRIIRRRCRRSWRRRKRKSLCRPTRESAIEKFFAQRAYLVHAALQAALGAANAVHGAFELVDAGVELPDRGVGVQETGGKLLDGRLDFLLENL